MLTRYHLAAISTLVAMGVVAVLLLNRGAARQAVLERTGWRVPKGATLVDEERHDSPFGGRRRYVFALPASNQAQRDFCSALELPQADPKMIALQEEQCAGGNCEPSGLDGQPLCSLVHSGPKDGQVFSIYANHSKLEVVWSYQ